MSKAKGKKDEGDIVDDVEEGGRRRGGGIHSGESS